MAVAVFSLELASGALTRWQGVAPTCLCRHDGAVIASDGQALYRLAGDSDDGAPLAVRVRLPASDGGLPGPKRLRTVRLEGVIPNRVMVSAQSDGGVHLEGTAGPAGQDGLPSLAVAHLGRGQGRMWRLDICAEDGSGLDIAAIGVEQVALDRRDG
jgi:hypothetical protein